MKKSQIVGLIKSVHFYFYNTEKIDFGFLSFMLNGILENSSFEDLNGHLEFSISMIRSNTIMKDSDHFMKSMSFIFNFAEITSTLIDNNPDFISIDDKIQSMTREEFKEWLKK